MAATFFVAAPLLLASPASAKEFGFPKVSVAAYVERDGSMTVVEDRTYRFEGDFSRGFIFLPRSGRWEFTGFGVSEGAAPYRLAALTDRDPVRTPGTYHVDEEGEYVKLTWYYRAADEDRTFRLSYRVLRAVKAHDDTAELYWKFLGGETEVGTERFTYSITLPPPGAAFPDLRIWQHGPLNGVIQSTSLTSIVGTTTNVPPNTFVEARVLFPPALVPGAERVPGSRMQQVIDEETVLSQEANRTRLASRLKLGAAMLVAVASLASLSYLYLRHGKEHEPFVGDYIREVPDYAPAVMGYIYRYGSTSTNDLTATLMDLARRGHLTIAESEGEGWFGGKTYTFSRTLPSVGDPLTPFEAKLLEWAFDRVGDGRRVTDTELAEWAKAPSNDFSSWWSDWKSDVRSEADRLGWIERGSRRMAGLNAVLGVVAIGLGALIVSMDSPAGVAPIVAGVVQVVSSPAIRRRSMWGATEYQKQRALRRFLLDFSEIQRMPPSALSVWEQYLVYAMPLGVADRVLDSMRRLQPAYVASGDTFTPSWFASSSGQGGFPDFSSLSGSISSFVSASTSSSSSSSGGGGGSSGGGGGGGGGGGSGAD